MTIHVDSYELRKPEVTDEGFLRFEGVIATPGIMVYWRDGEAVREYVPADTLQDQSYIDSLEGMPLTVEHPDPEEDHTKVITVGNNDVLSVGTVFNVRWLEDEGLVSQGIIRDPKGLAAYKGEGPFSRPKRQLSPAYEVTLQETEGVNEYGRYDAVQVDREAGNHVALTSKGRDGKQSSIRVDAFVESSVLTEQPFDETEDTSAPDLPAFNEDSQESDHDTTEQGESKMATPNTTSFKLDGLGSIELPTGKAALLQQWHSDQIEDIEDLKSRIKTLVQERDELQAELEKLKKMMDEGEMPKEGDGSESSGEMAEQGAAADMMDEDMSSDMAYEEDSGDGRTDAEGTDGSLHFDSKAEWYEQMQRVEETASHLNLDSGDVPTDVEDGMRTIVESWRGDDCSELSGIEVRAKFDEIATLVDQQTSERRDALDKINGRTNAGGSGEDDELSGRERYKKNAFG